MYYERICSPQKAISLFDEELITLNLSYKLSFIGNSPFTSKCTLYHLDNSIADVGNGKGLGLNSEISAKYEALEHYLSTQKSALSNTCFFTSFHEIKNKLSAINIKALPSNLMTTDNEKIKTAWITLKSYSNDHLIYVPYFSVNPDYIKTPFQSDQLNYSTFLVRTTNNGTAIGATLEEAILHAINELVERDAISTLLLSAFAKDRPHRIKILDKSSLPVSLLSIVKKIESDYQEEMLIFDITNDIGIPVFCATFTKQGQSIQPMGFGASLNPCYAVERALLEALQSLHLYDNTLREEDDWILGRFNQWPKLKKCAKCDLLSLVKSGNIEERKFLDSANLTDNLQKTIERILDILSKSNLQVFYTNHYYSVSGIACVKVVIPGLEQFHRVRYGSFVIPNDRGVAVLLAQST